MKNINLLAVLSCLSLIIFTACAKKPQEPYYDRAKAASQQAQNQLQRD